TYHHVCCSILGVNDTPTPDIYTLSLHDALPIWLPYNSGSHPSFLNNNLIKFNALPTSPPPRPYWRDFRHNTRPTDQATARAQRSNGSAMWPTSTVRSGSKECGKTAIPFAKRGDNPRLARSLIAKQDHGLILWLGQRPDCSRRPAITPQSRCQKFMSPIFLEEPSMPIQAYGAYSGTQPLDPLQITRRAPGAHDVQIDILYCGICHSDLHQVRSEWAGTKFPCVPGHEIVGRVSAVGAQVSRYQVGDLVGVGCIVDSCRHCEDCEAGLENYCNGMVGTYNSPIADEPGWTLGGYSQRIVVHERYVLRIRHPENQLAAVAPLLCAGITTYSPLRHWKVRPGQKV